MSGPEEFERIVTWKAGMPWEAAIEEMRLRREAVRRMGGNEAVARHHAQGKLTIRERIDRLADKGTFLEVGSLSGKGEYDAEGNLVGFTPAAFVDGLAEIEGRLVAVGGEDFTISGGSPKGILKDAEGFMLPLCIQYGIPCVQLCDGAGFNPHEYEESQRMWLPPSADIWWWPVQALQRVPMVVGILGPAAGHVAGRAMLNHFSVMVKGKGQVFPSGPPLVARSQSSDVSKDELGGTRMHRESGAIDNEAENEEDCFDQIRKYLSYMPNNVWEVPERKDLGDDPRRREEALLGIVPLERKKPYDMRKLMRYLVDRGEFFEMRRHYGASLITAFARMDGYPVGILASNPLHLAGAIDGPAAIKMTRFVDLCSCFNIPVVLLADVPGLMIGLQGEKTATVRWAMTAIMAGCEATVPKVQINIRKAYGMGSGAFNSVGGMLNLNLRFGWPSGEWGPIPVEGGVAAAYRREIESAPDPEARRKELEDRLIRMRSPFRAAEAGDVTDIIDPRDTRAYICRFIKAAQPALKRSAAGPKRSLRP